MKTLKASMRNICAELGMNVNFYPLSPWTGVCATEMGLADGRKGQCDFQKMVRLKLTAVLPWAWPCASCSRWAGMWPAGFLFVVLFCHHWAFVTTLAFNHQTQPGDKLRFRSVVLVPTGHTQFSRWLHTKTTLFQMWGICSSDELWTVHFSVNQSLGCSRPSRCDIAVAHICWVGSMCSLLLGTLPEWFNFHNNHMVQLCS